MKTIKKVIELPKYELSKVDSDLEFEDIVGLVESGLLKAAYNKNNTGGSHNFLRYNELPFEDIYDVLEFADGKPFAVISLYRENGYDGVYVNQERDAMIRRCNNWVEGGRRGLLYVIAGEQNHIDEFVSSLESWINYGADEFMIYDNETDEVVNCFTVMGGETPDGLYEWAERYGFTKKDIERVG